MHLTGALGQGVPLSYVAKDDLKWQKDNNHIENCIYPPITDCEIFCDASDFAWGGVFETKPTVDAWSETGKGYHINHLNLICKANISKHFQATQLL